MPPEDNIVLSAEFFDKAAFQATYINPFHYYLENISNFLNDEVETIQKDIEAIEKSIDSDENAFKDFHQKPEEISNNEFWLEQFSKFENMLLESFFVAVYGFLESQLMQRCRELEQQNKDIKPSLQDWRDRNNRKSTIIQAINYLVEVQQVDFSLKKYPVEWKKIDNYGPLRNCIVHNESRVDEGFNKKQRTKLSEFIRWKDSNLQFSDPSVVLTKEFCQDSLTTIWKFLKVIKWAKIQAG